MPDWVEWHRAYDDPESGLSRRLVIVRRRLHDALDTMPATAPRILSLCSGDGRDLIPVLAARSTEAPPVALLVEQDPVLAGRAADAAAGAGLGGVHVRCADAGDPSVFVDWLPVDLIMLCGIFGNVSQHDVRTTITSLPALVAPDGLAVWTRGRSNPDLRPAIRAWFTEAGFAELSYDGDPQPFAVGVNRVTGESQGAVLLPPRLFTFLPRSAGRAT